MKIAAHHSLEVTSIKATAKDINLNVCSLQAEAETVVGKLVVW